MPKVSVIIPTYNNAKFISEAIDSVIAQTRRDTEIIVVDDGSTDDTEKVLRDYGDKIVYFRQATAGPAKARNTGILHAKGEYVAFLDADDIWLPDKLKDQLDIMGSDSDIAFTYSKAILFGSETGAQDGGILPEKVFSGHVFEALLSESGPIVLSSVMVRSRILKEAGGFDESLFVGEDQHLWLRIAKTHKVFGVDRALIRRRLHSNNLSFRNEHCSGILDCLDRIVSLYPETDPRIYAPMNKAYRAHGEACVKTLLHFSDYGRCHNVCKRMMGVTVSPKILLYWIITAIPRPVLNIILKLRRKITG